MSSSLLSTQEIAKHNSKDDCWVIIRGQVYDVTAFLDQHPGGARILLKFAGKDATEEYEPIHPANALDALPANSLVGALDPKSTEDALVPAPHVSRQNNIPVEQKPTLAACLSLNDIEDAAEKLLRPRSYAFFKSGADDEFTANRNSTIFRSITFRPRILIDISTVSLRTTVLGQQLSMPILIAPAAMAKQAHPDGELALARAAAKYGVGQGVCTNASYGYEEMAADRDARRKVAGVGEKNKFDEEMVEQTFFYQVYVHKDRSVTEKALKRVKELGYKGLLLTVDAPIVGKRERDERINIITELSQAGEGGSATTPQVGMQGIAKASSTYFDIKIIWSDLAWIRSIVGPSMPIAIKGIQTAEDAALCAVHGVSVYISNHGGRQLNGAPTSIEVLLEIRKHCPWVFDTVEVFVDGGYRRGTDVLKAIALGARAVFLGRPFLYSLAFGQEGAEKVIEILAGEIMTAMRLLGVRNLRELGPQHVNAKELENVVSDQYHGPSKPWFNSLRARL